MLKHNILQTHNNVLWEWYLVNVEYSTIKTEFGNIPHNIVCLPKQRYEFE